MKSIEWAAGLFEGEGCISKRTPNKYQCSLEMTDKDVVEDFFNIIGYGNMSTRQRGEWKRTWTWSLYAIRDVRKFLEAILPYLGERRAYKALNCLDDIDNYFYLKQNHGNLV